jgi:hypothetical protein
LRLGIFRLWFRLFKDKPELLRRLEQLWLKVLELDGRDEYADAVRVGGLVGGARIVDGSVGHAVEGEQRQPLDPAVVQVASEEDLGDGLHVGTQRVVNYQSLRVLHIGHVLQQCLDLCLEYFVVVILVADGAASFTELLHAHCVQLEFEYELCCYLHVQVVLGLVDEIIQTEATANHIH